MDLARSYAMTIAVKTHDRRTGMETICFHFPKDSIFGKQKKKKKSAFHYPIFVQPKVWLFVQKGPPKNQ